MSGSFGAWDWAVVVILLLATTWIGHRAAGRQENLRDFFLGGRRLPWFAVAASIIATEISAVTFISLPSVVAREGGNWTYLQIGLFGSLFARGLIAWFLVPAYYEKEIFSPYDYMGAKLGEGVRRTASGLFAIGEAEAHPCQAVALGERPRHQQVRCTVAYACDRIWTYRRVGEIRVRFVVD